MTTIGKFERFNAHEAMTLAKARMAKQYHCLRANIPLGPRTGMPSVDDYLGGYLEPGLHLLLGRAGQGKSALAWQWAVNCGVPVLYLTAEIPPDMMVQRHTAMITYTLSKRLRACTIDEESAYGLIDRALPTMEHITILSAIGRAVSIDDLTKELVQVQGDSPHALIVVDSLHKWAVRSYVNASTEYEALTKAFLDLLELADAAEVPILIIGEKSLAKTSENEAESGAGSRRLAYDPVTVLNLTEVDPKNKGWTLNPFESRAMKLVISKQRHGQCGVEIPLFFYGAFYRFSDRELSEQDIKREAGLVLRPDFGQSERSYHEAQKMVDAAFIDPGIPVCDVLPTGEANDGEDELY